MPSSINAGKARKIRKSCVDFDPKGTSLSPGMCYSRKMSLHRI